MLIHLNDIRKSTYGKPLLDICYDLNLVLLFTNDPVTDDPMFALLDYTSGKFIQKIPLEEDRRSYLHFNTDGSVFLSNSPETSTAIEVCRRMDKNLSVKNRDKYQ